MVKLIIFDYDGVIVDSFSNVHSVYQTICQKLGKSCPKNLEDFKKAYGYSSSDCYSGLGFSKEERIKGNEIFREEILKKNPKLFKGIAGVLKELYKNYELALVSSNYEEEVKQKLKKFKLAQFFNFILARENCAGRFEKTESIKKIMKKLAIEPEDVLLVGDRNVDFIEASKAGLNNVILVDYGWGYSLEKIPGYKQRVVVKRPSDLLEAVKRF